MFSVLNKSTIFVKSLISQSVCLMQWKELFFGGRWRDPCNLSGIQLARKFMKLNNFICLTYHLSNNLKIYHKFSPTIYTNQMFWFHLCYMHSSCSYDPLNKIMCFVLLNFTKVFQKRFYSILLVMHGKCIGRQCCFYFDEVQKYTKVFKLKIFILHIQNFR